MKENIIETIVGLIVLVIVSVFCIFAYTSGGNSRFKAGYIINAKFDNIEGIVIGSDVMMSGVKIGYVQNIKLDKINYLAELDIHIDKMVSLPKDSRAMVVSSGFLGSKFIAITPGNSQQSMNPDDDIKYTQSSINLESLIGKFIYSSEKK